jgi:SAM-dependent methyltransferase
MLLDSVLQLPQKLRYKLFDAPKGYGLPVSAKLLEQQYKDGFWEFLDSTDELANYMVTVGYVQHLAKALNSEPQLLDIGCGHGNLAELLSGYPLKSYLGVDVSAEAVRQATARGLKNFAFQVADVEEWMPSEKFDFILSTGSICYFKDPVAFLQRYSAALNEGGAFIISLWRYGHNSAIWRNIEEHFTVLDSTVVTNRKGQMWDVKVLR